MRVIGLIDRKGSNIDSRGRSDEQAIRVLRDIDFDCNIPIASWIVVAIRIINIRWVIGPPLVYRILDVSGFHRTDHLENSWEFILRDKPAAILIENAEHVINQHIVDVFRLIMNELAEGWQVDCIRLWRAYHVKLAPNHLIVTKVIFEVHHPNLDKHLQTLWRKALEHISLHENRRGETNDKTSASYSDSAFS